MCISLFRVLYIFGNSLRKFFAGLAVCVAVGEKRWSFLCCYYFIELSAAASFSI